MLLNECCHRCFRSHFKPGELMALVLWLPESALTVATQCLPGASGHNLVLRRMVFLL